ncbi:hypothetical protein IWZ01DRAFT_487779 [Phyllosticta capitalensis]
MIQPRLLPLRSPNPKNLPLFLSSSSSYLGCRPCTTDTQKTRFPQLATRYEDTSTTHSHNQAGSPALSASAALPASQPVRSRLGSVGTTPSRHAFSGSDANQRNATHPPISTGHAACMLARLNQPSAQKKVSRQGKAEDDGSREGREGGVQNANFLTICSRPNLTICTYPAVSVVAATTVKERRGKKKKKVGRWVDEIHRVRRGTLRYAVGGSSSSGGGGGGTSRRVLLL